MKEIIVNLLAKHVKMNKEELAKAIELPPDSSLGDYAFPCFILAREMKRKPVDISTELARELTGTLPKEISGVKAQGAYLNFFIDKKVLAEKTIAEILIKKANYGKSKEKGKIIIDFSGPNIGKPMHIGHIRSTIIGDSLLKIYNFLGYDVKGINYLGDTGLHIGKLIVAYELWLDKKALEKNPINELLRLYIKFCDKEKTEYQEGMDDEFNDNEWTNKAKEKLKLIETGDKKTHEIWQDILKHSKKGFDKVYKLLNVNFNETTGQSLFSDKGKKIIEEALKKGLANVEKDGAVFIEFPDLPKKYVLRSNGTAAYITQDIGAAVERYKKYKFDKMIYVTDFRQELHFQQLFAILKKFNYNFSDKLVHVKFGTVNFGKEIMATRKGKVILLEEVLMKTIEKAESEIKKRKAKGNAEIIGVGAIKYAILKNSPQQDVNFSWEQALNFEGETGPYLQYSYARASSILKKAKKKANVKVKALEEKEIELVKKLSIFSEVVSSSGLSYSPSLIANYSFELSKIFNEFYHACKVIDSEEEPFRLSLVQSFKIVIKQALHLLGIDVMEEM